MKTTTLNLDDVRSLTEESKKRNKLRAIQLKKAKSVRERKERLERIEQLKDVSFFESDIKVAASKGKNKYYICLFFQGSSNEGNVYFKGKFNKKLLSEYTEDNVIHMRAIATKLKPFSPRIYVKTIQTDNGFECANSESNIEYREWRENRTYVEFTW